MKVAHVPPSGTRLLEGNPAGTDGDRCFGIFPTLPRGRGVLTLPSRTVSDWRNRRRGNFGQGKCAESPALATPNLLGLHRAHGLNEDGIEARNTSIRTIESARRRG
ncbi:MAG: hypothetical protein OXB95_03465 [Rhodobacteraceae bacterium]|nr:hypothetical protein [Paracoccaceae bacterium]